jgi:hypothetical protein
VLVLFRTASHRTGRARFRASRLSSEVLREPQDTQNRFGATHYAYLSNSMCPLHLAPFALWAAFPPSSAGRDSGDYCGASVALGLAPDRRSHVRRCRTWQRDLGVPLIS